MNITRLTVSNLLRIRAAEVKPDGSLVIVGGRNDQGKSSLLNAIAIGLSGKDLPTQPIRTGSASGHVILEISDGDTHLVVTKRFSMTGGAVLEIRDQTGSKITSPQAKLDALVSRRTFDPFEFTREEPDKQLATLKRIVGLDFTDLEKEHKEKYDLRTALNRQVRDQDGKLKGITRHSDAPAEPVSVADLMAELETAQKTQADNDGRRQALSDINDELDEMPATMEAKQQAVEHLKNSLKVAEAAVKEYKTTIDKTVADRDALKSAIDALNDPDTAGITEQIRTADERNQKLRDNEKWNEEHRTLISLQQQAQVLTTRLEAIDAEKKTKLEKAEFPVPGLGFGANGVTYNDVPFEQAGTAVKIRTSIAIARSLNPKLPVMLIHDGSLLDEDSLSIVAEEAEKYGTQVWLEVVGSPDDATVIIEDGEVAATPAADSKKKSRKN